jgi:Tol biopolymer transport system component
MSKNRFDHLVWGIISGLILINVALVLGGTQIGFLPSDSFPLDEGETGMLGPIWIEFPLEMRTESVESTFSISPAVAGEFLWSGNRLEFIPDKPLEIRNRYTIRLQPGSEAKDGRRIKEELSWSFTIRQPWIIYLSYTDPGGELYRVQVTGSESEKLTETGGRILDFDPSPNGEQIAYSQGNDQDGIDIWLMDRDGGSQSLFLDCGPNRCLTPEWSPSGNQIAYSRAEAGLSPGEGFGQFRIWLADLETGETARLFQNSQKIGYGPDWSPDGRRLAYFDGANRQIAVIDLDSGDEFTIPSQIGRTGSWSPDGSKLLYSDMIQVEDEFSQVIYLVDLETQDSVLLYGGKPDKAQFSDPVWSPTGERVMFTTWQVQEVTERVLLDMSYGNSWGTRIDDEPKFIFRNYVYDPTGRQIVYERLPLETGFARPEILLYDSETQNVILLAENASSPAWLP